MSVQETLDAIKYVAWHDIRLLNEGADESNGTVRLRLPAREDLLNYVGTGHAGAIYTLAETAAGVAADSLAQTIDAFILLRGAQVNYTRRAGGDLTAQAIVPRELEEQLRRAFAELNRADLPIEVDIRDHENQSVFNGVFNYALRARK